MSLIIIIAATGLGAAIGAWTRRQLATLTYRLEEEHGLPEPGNQSWLIVASGLALGSVTGWLAHGDNWPRAFVVLPLTLVGPALAAIDLDVMRLPNRLLGPVALLTVTGVVVVAAWTSDWRMALVSLGGGLLAGATFWVLNTATRGGVGFGDVKLAAVVGVAMGSASLGTVWFSVLIGALIALLWRRWLRLPGPVPFGPMLLIGAWMALLLSGV